MAYFKATGERATLMDLGTVPSIDMLDPTGRTQTVKLRGSSSAREDTVTAILFY